MQELFQIKVCGVTRAADVQMIVQAGVDAIGLNFFPGSSRYIDLKTAAEICDQISPHQHLCERKVWKIGVFVNASVDQMLDVQKRLNLDGLQLHGDENPNLTSELIKRLPQNGSEKVALIRAIRCPLIGEPDLKKHRITVVNEIDHWVRKGIDVILFDAGSSSGFGGTGKSLDWKFASQIVQNVSVPVVLAGGLNPDNVDLAIKSSKIRRVDVASGVESAPGIKDETKVQQFVAKSRLIHA